MENASKALLIAAAVLIVILLVAFGMSVFNSTGGTKESATTTGKAISAAAFNAKFKPYLGASKSKEEIIELINTVEKSNNSNTREVYIRIPIDINGKDGSTISKPKTQINYENKRKEIAGKNFKMNVYVYYDTEGYIAYIGINSAVNKFVQEYNNKLSKEKGW